LACGLAQVDREAVGMSTPYYILDGKTPVPCFDILKWGEFFKERGGNVHVAKTGIGEYHISTVFLGIDHAHHAYGAPLLFETMIFGGILDGEYQERCSTWEEAEKLHEEAITFLKGKGLV
jgi:hypothetical protein